jgi:hypothetical protein
MMVYRISSEIITLERNHDIKLPDHTNQTKPHQSNSTNPKKTHLRCLAAAVDYVVSQIL